MTYHSTVFIQLVEIAHSLHKQGMCPMLDYNSLRLSRRTRGVNHVCIAIQINGGQFHVFGVIIKGHVTFRNNDTRITVLNYEIKAFFGIFARQGKICCPCLENCNYGNHPLLCSFKPNSDEVVYLNTIPYQAFSQNGGTTIQFLICQRAIGIKYRGLVGETSYTLPEHIKESTLWRQYLLSI